MVVVFALVELVHRTFALKVAAFQNVGLLKLHQHAVDRGNANVHVLQKQMAIHVFGRHVPLRALLEDFQNFQARCGGFEANAFEVVWMCHFVFLVDV